MSLCLRDEDAEAQGVTPVRQDMRQCGCTVRLYGLLPNHALLDQGGALRAPLARRQRRPPALGRPRPTHAGPYPQATQIKAAQTPTRPHCARAVNLAPNVQLAATASRAPYGRRRTVPHR